MPELDLSKLSEPDNIPQQLRKKTIIAKLGKQEYLDTQVAMQNYTKKRLRGDPNQIWLVEHPPVFTQGKSSKDTDILKKLPAPLVNTDRGGQITYHGPGQLVVYYMINLKEKADFGLKNLVDNLEETILHILDFYDLKGYNDPKNRGIYLNNRKIASIGLRVKSHCSYHGFALNVNMDLSPFEAINPCGVSQNMTQIADHHVKTSTIVTVCLQALKTTLTAFSPFCILTAPINKESHYVSNDKQMSW